MPLLSYSQNGEDVVLHRALKDVELGHYVDIGAHDPEIDSVTKIFYDRGWSGINVEASEVCFEQLSKGRPRDLNLHAAAAAQSGMLRFYEVLGTGMSTLDPAAAAVAAEHHGYSVTPLDVPAVTLAEVCQNLPFTTTHFLKIDVEGGELGVLQGADFSSFRPWIVVVEATKPNTTERADGAWRGLLEAADYESVLFDGLNLFFLAREHPELREWLSAPANVLDDFVATPLRDARAKVEQLHVGNVHLAQKYDEAVAWAKRERSLLVERHEADLAWAANERTALFERYEADLAWAVNERAALVERYEADLAWAADERTALERKRQYDLAVLSRDNAEVAEQLRDMHAYAVSERDAERNLVVALRMQHQGDLAERDERQTADLADAAYWIAALENGRAEAEAVVFALRGSSSWRITRPIRAIGYVLRGRMSLGSIAIMLRARLSVRSAQVPPP